MSRSIMQTGEYCYLCGSEYKELYTHHVIYNGNSQRKKSEHYGLKVRLCYDCHQGDDGVHNNREKRYSLNADAQRAFEKKYPTLSFLEIFGKNYL